MLRVRLQVHHAIRNLQSVFCKPQRQAIDVLLEFAPSYRSCRVDFWNDPSHLVGLLACSLAESVVERAVHVGWMEGYLGSDAIDEVIEFAVVSVLHQAVDIGVKAWEFFVEHAGEL